jgi:hypothetical protein
MSGLVCKELYQKYEWSQAIFLKERPTHGSSIFPAAGYVYFDFLYECRSYQ